jgi:hypothetical protein
MLIKAGTYKVLENNIIILYQNKNSLTIYGNKEGAAKLTIREDKEDGKLIGTVNFVVPEAESEDDFDW